MRFAIGIAAVSSICLIGCKSREAETKPRISDEKSHLLPEGEEMMLTVVSEVGTEWSGSVQPGKSGIIAVQIYEVNSVTKVRELWKGYSFEVEENDGNDEIADAHYDQCKPECSKEYDEVWFNPLFNNVAVDVSMSCGGEGVQRTNINFGQNYPLLCGVSVRAKYRMENIE